MSIGQMGTLRRISYLRNVYDSKGPKVLEHVTSLAIIKETLKEYARGNVTKTEIKAFFDTLYLDVIPKEVDLKLESVGLENRYTKEILAMLKEYSMESFNVKKALENNKESKRVENAIKAALIEAKLKPRN